MATLADELLNDFEESDSEGEGEQTKFRDDEAERPSNGLSHQNGVTDMDMEDEDGGGDEEDEDANTASMIKTEGLEADDDEEEAKAKVEKMELGAVKDVRNVAGLMKKLEPVLNVSLLFIPFYSPCSENHPRFTIFQMQS